MRQKVNRLQDDIKFQVVQEYLGGGFTQKELMLKYNFKGKHCINNWIRKFEVTKPNTKPTMAKQTKQTKPNDKDYSLELRIKTLEEELKREQFKTLALNTMINVAERELKVDIRKKSGAKR